MSLTIAEIAALDMRGYVAELKARLRNDEAWVSMLEPVLVERTRFTLGKIISSIDAQKARVDAEGSVDAKWLSSVNALRRHATARLDLMPPAVAPISANRDVRAWRAFSARLARLLDESSPGVLDGIEAPHGGLTATQWLKAREAKGKK